MIDLGTKKTKEFFLKSSHRRLLCFTIFFTTLASEMSFSSDRQIPAETQKIDVGEGSQRVDFVSDGYDYDLRSIPELRERTRRLEIAVIQLQEEIYRLRSVYPSNIPGSINPGLYPDYRRPFFSCSVTTSFGIFLGKGDTEIEAKGNAVNKCLEKLTNGFCSSNIKCERSY
ncbi:MAG: hypothetical protein HQK54_03395 [Oligoflexales bacterium]|nr:hypothetical protein [Oligoflexales bacterium]